MIWQDALGKFGTSPYVGRGVGSYLIQIPAIGFTQADPSNVFLLNLVEVGVVGLLIFILILLSIAIVTLRNSSIFKSNSIYTVLSAVLAAAFFSHIAHIQIDVSWVRGTGAFAFACVGLLLKLHELYSRDHFKQQLPPQPQSANYQPVSRKEGK